MSNDQKIRSKEMERTTNRFKYLKLPLPAIVIVFINQYFWLVSTASECFLEWHSCEPG